jgi:DNA-binding NarL/FixJ family response regulator
LTLTLPPDSNSAADSLASLTPREAEVMAWVLRGLTNKAIAQRLAVSEYTARDHVRSLLRKFGAANRCELAVKYLARHRSGG